MVTKKQIDVLRSKLSELREATALLSLRLAMKKFDPNQPRWPGGSSWGGRWRDTGDGGSEPTSQLVAVRRTGVYRESRMPGCLAQLHLDEELCRMVQTWRCWERSQERYNNCMKGVYIPPLEVGR